jgi:prepilin-type N-terminal cleavage/methylation domain-containing protein
MRRTAGFTLLEVLVAIMIFVLAIAAILPLFAVGSTSHKRGVDQSRVAWIAPRIAAKLQENLYDHNPKDVKDGVWKEGSMSYLYDAVFTPVRLGSKDPLINTAFLLKVEVRWQDSPETRTEVFETVVLRKLYR